ncbi:hypothetical protein AtubIFM61612_003549 [Aspergillus tubingensis]|nr:hypothetical protein AtubIFM61612_003549 [Aspergillus tubingensis]
MELRQTNHVAELAACERALTDAWTIQKEWDDIGEEIEGDKGRLYRVVIKSDSEVDSIVESLEKEQVIVQFWHVPREYNQEADKLATSALDGN